MRSNYNLLYLIVFLLSSISLFAQQKTYSGTVSDSKGIPLPGVNIIVEGTSQGTQTDFDGNYSIEASLGQTLNYSFLGYETVSIKIGPDTAQTINVTLEPSSSELEEVVVTAQGISRAKKALGYSVSTLGSEEVESKPEADIARVLRGKVAGVDITNTGGLAGSGTNFVIRGQSSITQSNQPLFIVDGVPFNTDTNPGGSDFIDGGYTSSSRFLDLDPNNIESVSVLKGLSATVLYGEQGRNGVVLITTKNGSTDLVNKGFEIAFSQSVYFNEIAQLPDYTNLYGNGADNEANNGFVGNWGDRLDQGITLPHVYDKPHLNAAFPEYIGLTEEYKAYPNNVADFFRSGLGTNTSVNASKSSEDVSYNINFGHTNEEGFVPGNSIKRINFGLGGSAKLSNKFTFNGSFNFSSSEFMSPPTAAGNGAGALSIFLRTLFTPRSFDLMGLPYQNPITGGSVYYRTDQENPQWLVDNSRISENINRFYNSVSVDYDISPKSKLTYRVGLDTYTNMGEFYINKGGVSNLYAQIGYLRNTTTRNTIWDHSLIYNLSDVNITDKLGFNSRLGVNARLDEFDKKGVASSGQIVFDFINHSNFESQTNLDPLGSILNYFESRSLIGLYGQLEFDYDNYLYLTLSGRNDWGSTVEPENQSLFYPSASLSMIPTTMFKDLRSDFLNFLKLRVAYGTSAGYPEPYRTRPTLNILTSQFIRGGQSYNLNSSGSVFPNPDLKPELHREIELGLETNLWKNKINLEVSAYRRLSNDQILNRFLDPSTGYTSTTINAGEIENKGIEATLGIAPFTGDFQWNNRQVFTIYKTVVNELPDDIDQIIISGFSNLGNIAKEGERLGAILGSYALRDDEGNYLIDPNDGTLITNSDVGLPDKIIGNPQPDWKLTSINTFSYKGLSLSAQLEYTHGGDFYSTTIGNLLRRGVTKDTEDREGTYSIPGYFADPGTGEVLLDENGEKIPNDIQLGANEIWFLNYTDPSDQEVYDGSVIRLREISLGYDLPKKYLEKLPLGTLSFSIMGQNLWYHAPNVPEYTNFDPETLSTGVGNGMGLDFQTAPNSKKYGFSIKATF